MKFLPGGFCEKRFYYPFFCLDVRNENEIVYIS